MRAAFAEIEITPDPGITKIGMLREIVTTHVDDPLFARVAVLEHQGAFAGFIQLDTLSIRWTQVRQIRERVEARTGVPGSSVMVSATHNHAGPAVANVGRCQRDDSYVAALVNNVCAAFESAVASLEEVELGFEHTYNFTVGHNRRLVMRDGTVKTQGSFADHDALFVEGPEDPEVGVLAARTLDGHLAGCILNYACHPTHSAGDQSLSAGFPGVFAREMKAYGCPVALFLNGASGNIHTKDPAGRHSCTKEEAGQSLASDAQRVLQTMAYHTDWTLGVQRRQLDLPYRAPSDAEIRGDARGAQRFVDPQIYDDGMSTLLKRINERKVQPAEVQVLRIGPVGVVGIPAEYFVEYGLSIKERVSTLHALVAGLSNGMVGYVPTREAFVRGGYETTFAHSSRLAPEAGDMLADTAVDMLNDVSSLSSF